MTAQRLVLPRCRDELDTVVSEYVEALWQEGEGRNRAADTLSGIQWAVPGYKGLLRGAWNLIGAWQRNELPERAPPLPVICLLACAETALRMHDPVLATLVLVGAHCLLRTGELVQITSNVVKFDATYSTAVISLGATKSGKRAGVVESVQVKLPWLAKLLASALSAVGTDAPLGGPSWLFRQKFEKLTDACGLAAFGFRPYSLRRGGATELWRTTSNLDAVVMAGRWRHATTARIYVSDGLAVLTEIKISSAEFASARQLAVAFCARFAVAPKLF